jgi:hypothetical protein
MKMSIKLPLFSFGFALIAGCSSHGDDPSTETETSAADEQPLLAGDMEDLSGIAFDDPNDKALDEGGEPAVMATIGHDPALSRTAALTPDDAQDDGDVDAPATDTTPEEAAAATPESTIGIPPQNRPKMSYHGGPVMDHQNVYLIYYGNWAHTKRTRSLIHQFVSALGHDDFNHQYWDGLEYKDHAGDAAASKGLAMKGAAGVGYPYGKKLSQTDVARVVHSVLNAAKFSPDKKGLYLVMTSADVAVGGDTGYCGWHNEQQMDIRFQDNFEVTLNVKYGLILNANRPHADGSTCSEFGSPAHHGRTPNRDYVADSEVSVLSHEIVETMTDPRPWTAWYSGSGSNSAEVGDKCAWNFPKARKVNRAWANLYDRHYKRWWLVQSEYRHNDACGMGAAQ